MLIIHPHGNSLVFHYTSEAGKLSPGSTKKMHISTVNPLELQFNYEANTGVIHYLTG